jgi:rubrerythrin
MQAERIGHEFYKNAAQTTTDPTGRDTFLQLAREEQEHFEFLATHYKSLVERGVLSGAKLGHAASHPADNPIFSPELRGRIKQAHFEMSALAIAVQLELNGITHYREQAAKATLPEVKSFYEELVAWEGVHYDALLRQQQMLQEEYWADAGFSPF